MFFDADDTLNLNALEVLDNAIKTYKEPSCLVFGFTRVRENKIISIITEEQTQVLKTKEEIYKKLLSNSSYNSICRKCIRTDILKKLN